MKQAVLVKPESFEIREVPIPEITDDQALIRVRAVGICGSDIHAYYGKHPFISCPIVMGHEAAGDVVKIGKNVWLGDNVVILPGVTVGDGCVIGANAVVTKDIPDYTVAGGCPAKPLKKYDFDARTWGRA